MALPKSKTNITQAFYGGQEAYYYTPTSYIREVKSNFVNSALSIRNITRNRAVKSALTNSSFFRVIKIKKLSAALVSSAKNFKVIPRQRTISVALINSSFDNKKIGKSLSSLLVQVTKVSKNSFRVRASSAALVNIVKNQKNRNKVVNISALQNSTTYFKKLRTIRKTVFAIATNVVKKIIIPRNYTRLIKAVQVWYIQPVPKSRVVVKTAQAVGVNLVKRTKTVSKPIKSTLVNTLVLSKKLFRIKSIFALQVLPSKIAKTTRKNKNVKVTQIVSATVTRRVTRRKNITATVTYTIANSKTKTLFRKIRATTVSSASTISRKANIYKISVSALTSLKQYIATSIPVVVSALITRKNNIVTKIPIIAKANVVNRNALTLDNWNIPQKLESSEESQAFDNGLENYAEPSNELGEAIIPDPNYNN